MGLIPNDRATPQVKLGCLSETPRPRQRGLHSVTSNCGAGGWYTGPAPSSQLRTSLGAAPGGCRRPPRMQLSFSLRPGRPPPFPLQVAIPSPLLVSESPCSRGTPPASGMLVPLLPPSCSLTAPCHLSAPPPPPPGSPLGLPLFPPTVRALPSLAFPALGYALLGTLSQFVMTLFGDCLNLAFTFTGPMETGTVSGFPHAISSEPSHAWMYLFDEQGPW